MTATPPERSEMAAGRFRSCAATHPGAVRARNEDSFVNRPDLGLWAVADGAGGHQSGDLASRMVAEALEAIPPGVTPPEMLAEVRRRLNEAHERLREEASRRGPEAMLASTVVVLLARDDHFACLWAGDSRAYVLRGAELAQITRDHSLVQELLEAGAISAADAETHPNANVITRAIGADADSLELDKVTGQLLPGDRFLLCSDGLSKTLPDTDLAALLASGDTPDVERLISGAVDQGATDNVTAVTIQVSEAG